MKTITFILAVFSAATIFSCKKEIDFSGNAKKSDGSKDSASGNFTGREVTLSNQDIIDWLEAQKAILNHNNDEFLENIIENLDMENKYVESESDEENLIIIPLKQEFTSNHIVDGPRLMYLLLKDNQQGNIRRGDVIFFYPTDGNVTELPENTFINYFQKETIQVDGQIIFITLDDIKEFQIQYQNGVKTAEEMWTGKVAEEDDDCLDWFMVTTTYNSEGEVIGEDWDYLYTSCNMNSGGGSGSGGNTGGGGGGGGNGSNNGTNGSVNGSGPQPGTPVNGIERIYKVGEMTERYTVKVKCIFDGIRYSNTALNQFTNMTISETQHNNWNTAGAYTSNSTWHSTWLELSNVGNYSPTLAEASASGKITYINQDPNSPGTEFVIQNWANWEAKNVFN